MSLRIDKKNPHLGGNVPGGDSWTFYPELWKWLIEKYNVASVLDIGCGTGESTKFFKDNDCMVFGIDGLEENIRDLNLKGIHGLSHDYTTGSVEISERYDLCWCCEFVEHVDEKYSDNFLDNFEACRVIAMTHAVPGQGGHHHVNCKNDAYWIDRLKDHGFKFDLHYSTLSRKLAKHYWSESGLIFTR
jgi:SAM-dependent methyltransferase